jgi:hypothetical protein
LETKAKENVMLLNAFTLVHVVLSLIGIGSGVVAIYGLKSQTVGTSCS